VTATDDFAIIATDVLIDETASTAPVSSYSCAQTDSKTATCTMDVDASGDITLTATDQLGNTVSATESGFMIDNVDPEISLDAPTKQSSSSVDVNFTVTDNVAISASGVTISASTTADYSNYTCTEASSTEVRCSLKVTGSGDLAINIEDHIGNIISFTESGFVIDDSAPTIFVVENGGTYVDVVTVNFFASDVSGGGGITPSGVSILTASTVMYENLACVQSNPNQVNCSIDVLSNGTLKIAASDTSGNSASLTTNEYLFDLSGPTISISAPQKLDNQNISVDVTVTDNEGLSGNNVVFSGVTLASESCTPTSSVKISCTVEVSGIGDLTVTADDNFGNQTMKTETGFVVDTVSPTLIIAPNILTSGAPITDTTLTISDNHSIDPTGIEITTTNAGGTRVRSARPSFHHL